MTNGLGLFEGLLEEDLGDLAPKQKNKAVEVVENEDTEITDNNTTKNTPEKKEPAASKDKEVLPVDKTRIVCYAGHKIFIENRNLSLEQIRKQLEKEFPELSKGRTEMVYDDKTGIVVPIIKAKKNGGIR
jgi:hypothetical protein